MEIINYYKRNNGSEAVCEHIGFHESGDYLVRWLFGSGPGFRYHRHEFEKEFVLITKHEVDLLERQRCPRRNESTAGLEKAEFPDYWRNLPNGDRTCSFCGSIHPTTVLEIIKKHGFISIEPSTKSYKWYINRPEVKNAGDGGIKYYRQHDTDEFIREYNAMLKSN